MKLKKEVTQKLLRILPLSPFQILGHPQLFSPNPLKSNVYKYQMKPWDMLRKSTMHNSKDGARTCWKTLELNTDLMQNYGNMSFKMYIYVIHMRVKSLVMS